MNIVLLPRAKRDIRSILDQFEWESGSPSVRERFLVAFEELCLLLAKYPYLGQRELAPSHSLYAQSEVRRFAIRGFPKHLVFYRVDKASIKISRVLHGARDPRLRTVDPL